MKLRSRQTLRTQITHFTAQSEAWHWPHDCSAVSHGVNSYCCAEAAACSQIVTVRSEMCVCASLPAVIKRVLTALKQCEDFATMSTPIPAHSLVTFTMEKNENLEFHFSHVDLKLGLSLELVIFPCMNICKAVIIFYVSRGTLNLTLCHECIALCSKSSRTY